MLLANSHSSLSILTQLLRSLTKNHPAFDDSAQKKWKPATGQDRRTCSVTSKTHGNKPFRRKHENIIFLWLFTPSQQERLTFVAKTSYQKNGSQDDERHRGSYSCLTIANVVAAVVRLRAATPSPWYSLLMVQTASEKELLTERITIAWCWKNETGHIG